MVPLFTGDRRPYSSSRVTRDCPERVQHTLSIARRDASGQDWTEKGNTGRNWVQGSCTSHYAFG